MYDEIGVPAGVELVSAEAVIPRSGLFFFQNEASGEADLGPFSDLFRFRLLWEKGGWYVDTDVICNSTVFPRCDFAWAPELPEISPMAIGTSQVKFPARSTITARLVAECEALRATFAVREELGPHLLSRVLSEVPTPASHYGTAASFYPLRWKEAYKLWLPGCLAAVEARCAGSLFVNCYNSLFSYMRLTEAGLPPRGSFLGRLYEVECPERAVGPDLSEADVLWRVRRWFEGKPWAIDELRAVAGRDALEMVFG